MKIKTLSFFLAALFFLSNSAFAQQGLTLSGVGAVNRSFGGVAVAAPIDAAGALLWNPASITAFDKTQMSFSLELLKSDITLRSSAGGVAGSSDSDADAVPIPSLATIYKPEHDCGWTYGMGFFVVGGLNTNYPASTTNPILAPQPPTSTGLGNVVSEAAIYQLVPTAAYKITDTLSFGFAPTLHLPLQKYRLAQ